MNLFHVFEQGNTVLIATFLLLIGMSITSWYVIFWKALKLKSEQSSLRHFRTNCMSAADWPRHSTYNNVSGNVASLIMEAEKLKPTLYNYGQENRKEILAMHLVQRLDVIRTSFDKGLTILASVGSSAPFIGLFGTVWGIYGALTKIALEGNAGLNVVAGPMGEALVATAVGLFTAIPAVLAYNAYVRLNRLMVQDLRHIAEQLTTYLSISAPSANTAETIKLVRK
jgi:biopolymer transport protein ExbB